MADKNSKNRKQENVRIIRIIAACFFGCVIIVSSIMLVTSIIGYKKAENIYYSLQEEFDKALVTVHTDETLAPVWTRTPDTDVKVDDTQPADTTALPDTTGADVPDTTSGKTVETTNPAETTKPDDKGNTVVVEDSESFKKIKEFLLGLQAVNEDVVGYISIKFDDGEEISYPVLQSGDNDYYISHGYDKSELKAGSIFLDYRNDKKLNENKASILYGHNMNDGSMFHNLTKFKNTQTFNNTNIVIYTMDGIYTYKVFSVYKTTSDNDYCAIDFYGDDDFVTFMGELQNRSTVRSNMSFYGSDSVLTLSTCMNMSADDRLAVHAVLISIEK